MSVTDSIITSDTEWQLREPGSYGAANPDPQTNEGLTKLRAAGASRARVESYLRDAVGVRPESFIEPALPAHVYETRYASLYHLSASDRARIAVWTWILAVPAGLALFLLPAFGFWITWVWFGARRKHGA
jgi:hypothetical protein